MRVRRYAIAVLSCVACHAPPSIETADVALLRAAVGDWQEGPTDGRVCLDARVLRDAPEQGQVTYWATPILTSLLADTLVAVDSSTLASANPALRYCVPGQWRFRVTLGVPRVHAHVADIRTTVWIPAHGRDTSMVVPSAATLAWRDHGWRVVAHPDMHFQILKGAH